MRFEGKHSYFKDIARCVKCFKNIPESLAFHHQRLMCYYLNSDKFFVSLDTLTGPGTMNYFITVIMIIQKPQYV